MQSSLAYCPAWGEFWDLWRRSWTDWAQHACQWQTTATGLELWLCARLLIWLSLINAIPTTKRHRLRAEVGLFQFRMIQAVQTLTQKLADPTPHQSPSPLWLTKFVAQTLPPRETAQNPRNHVGAPMRCDMKRKRRAESVTAEPIDPDLWLRNAHAANDNEAVAWFARIHETNTNQEEQTQKRQRLDVDARLWEHYLTASDKLAKEHAQRPRRIPQRTRIRGNTAAPTRTSHIVRQHTNSQNRIPRARVKPERRTNGTTTTAHHIYKHVHGMPTMV